MGTVGSAETGNGVVAPSFSRASNCAALRLPLTDAINPAMPETIGEEKLVPTLMLNWSVIREIVGRRRAVVRRRVDREEARLASAGVDAIAAGAPRATSVPRLANPTLVPAWRKPVIAATPGQLAGASTGPPSLPADATTSTPVVSEIGDDGRIARGASLSRTEAQVLDLCRIRVVRNPVEMPAGSPCHRVDDV